MATPRRGRVNTASTPMMFRRRARSIKMTCIQKWGLLAAPAIRAEVTLAGAVCRAQTRKRPSQRVVLQADPAALGRRNLHRQLGRQWQVLLGGLAVEDPFQADHGRCRRRGLHQYPVSADPQHRRFLRPQVHLFPRLPSGMALRLDRWGNR